ncbi:hypothetical protein [Lentzea sp. NPDC004782]|uniref:hypothetical protein n=1 Tax=Lentzea sp. NPDC004782 TaxID=3154458 RepID=UPI0033AA64D3
MHELHVNRQAFQPDADFSGAPFFRYPRVTGDESLAFDRAGDRWGARLETYFTDPSVEPAPSRRTTEVAIRLAD